ncbi:MAG: PglZ domain-containing protein, partial [bacterium]
RELGQEMDDWRKDLTDTPPILFLVVDCLRLDQWLAIEPLLREFFELKRFYHLSLIPTATPYSRNSIFSAMLPNELERLYPDLWDRGDEDESSSNRMERQLLQKLLERRGINLKPELRYLKILHTDEARELERKINDYLQTPLTAVVYNFVDILVHTRQSEEVLKEIIPDESAFRSVTRAWFPHSSLYAALQAYARAKGIVILTSDHGSLRVRKAIPVAGDRQTSSSLRYKFGRNLKLESKAALRIKNPSQWGLPSRGINTEYIIAREENYFLYPNNFHHYERLFTGSFQHGGISMEEMILPVIVMKGKGY